MLVAWALAAVALDRVGARRPEGSFDAIVVAGCRVMPDGRPSPALARRAELALELWRAGRAPIVVFTGGVGDHGASEASVAAAHAVALGLPRAVVRLEETSTSTEENARGAAALLHPDAEAEHTKVLVVTDTYHVLRCERVFGRYFHEVVGAGSKSVPYARAKGALREVPAVIAYALLGRL